MPIEPYLFERRLPLAALVFIAMAIGGCGEQQEPQDSTEFYGPVEHTKVDDPIEFTSEPYDFSGETKIADIVAQVPASECIWYGFSADDRFPRGDETILDDDCGDHPVYVTKVEEIDLFPARIEGVVTLHPRYFQKVEVCEQDQRFYGSFFIQDESGGMMVLKDSRVADFTFGERVSLRVRGVMKSFDQASVLVYDQQEVIEPGVYHDIHYKEVNECFGHTAGGSCGSNPVQLNCFDPEDIGEVVRIEGVVVSAPTNSNFNELLLEGDDGGVWSVSIDRELGNRGVGLNEGDRVRLTGPLVNSYGLNLLIASLGQIERLDADE